MKITSIHRARTPQPFLLPEGFSIYRYSSMPLYMIVAYWALAQRRPVTVKDVRTSFGITIRRASDLLEYISEKCSDSIKVDYHLAYPFKGKKLKRREWTVLSIEDSPENYNIDIRKPPKINIIPSPEYTRHYDLRKWMISRKYGEKVPINLL